MDIKESILGRFIKAAILTVILLFAAVNNGHTQNAKLDDFFPKADKFFNKYVIDGGVAYYALRQNPESVNTLVDMAGEVDLSGASAQEKKAFYINTYNIVAIYSVIKHDITESVMNRDGFFKQDKYNIAGERLTLDEIENKKLREVYKDPRTHFVLVCAAQSCPRLRNFAFYPDRLDNMLEAATYDFINNLDKTKVVQSEQAVYLSKIMEWFKGDFLWKADSLLEYVNNYRLEKIPANYSVKFYDYDWSLNEKKAVVSR